MTDILKDLDQRLEALKNGLIEAQEERAQAAADAVRKEAEAKIEALQKALEKAEDTRREVARTALPGIEYAKGGEEGKFSLWRALQLSVGEALPSSPEARLWNSKSHGLEVEAIKQLRSQVGVEKASMNIGTDAAGGVFVPSTVMLDSIIPELESLAIGYQLGVRRMDGLRGNFTWVVDEGGTTAYYIDSEAEEAVTSSQGTFSTISVRPHTMGAETNLTRGMRMQSAIAAEAWVRNRIAAKFALKEDYTLFFGTGTDSEPRGIVNVPTLNTAVNFASTDFLGADQTVTDKLREMVYAPLISNYVRPGARWGWAMRPEAGRKLANAKDADGKQLIPTADNGVLTGLMGAPVRYTTQPAAASSDEFVLYGDFSAAIICHWGGLDFKVGYTGTNQSKDVLTVTAFMDHDVIVEQGKAFVAADNFATT